MNRIQRNWDKANHIIKQHREFVGNVELIGIPVCSWIVALLLWIFAESLVASLLIGVGVGTLFGYGTMRHLLMGQMIEIGLVKRVGHKYYFLLRNNPTQKEE